MITKRRGPKPDPLKEARREVHVRIPASLARRMDDRRGNERQTDYILRLIEQDVEQKASET